MQIILSDRDVSPHQLPIHVGPPDQTTVIAYSDKGSAAYEDPENLSSLYGAISREFLEGITFRPEDRFVVDIGCGTGFAFDVMRDVFLEQDLVGIGVDPAPGMLDHARRKYKKNPKYRFLLGEGEAIPVPEQSVDRVISALAMHWVKNLDHAAAELRRILRNDGMVEILMIANEDGFVFKRAILAALRQHLTFSQILKAAGRVQRLKPEEFSAILEPHFEGFDVSVIERKIEVAGSLEDHIKWWRARSMPVVADIGDLDAFHATLNAELERISSKGKIVFDAAFLETRITPKSSPKA